MTEQEEEDAGCLAPRDEHHKNAQNKQKSAASRTKANCKLNELQMLSK